MRRLVPHVALAVVLITTGCDAGQPGAAGTPTVAATAGAATTETSRPASAGDVVKRLKDADLGLTGAAIQDEDTDPNDLLGRPNGYLSRASADLPGGDTSGPKYGIDRGLVVEVFATAEDAQARSAYILGLLKGSPLLGSEWHYTAADGRALVRVSGNVKPSLAKKIEAAAAKM